MENAQKTINKELHLRSSQNNIPMFKLAYKTTWTDIRENRKTDYII